MNNTFTQTNLQEALRLCDDRGQAIGILLPVAEHERLKQLETDYRRLQAACQARDTAAERLAQVDPAQIRQWYAWAQAQVSDAELDAAERETEEYTTAEVLRSRDSADGNVPR